VATSALLACRGVQRSRGTAASALKPFFTILIYQSFGIGARVSVSAAHFASRTDVECVAASPALIQSVRTVSNIREDRHV
jgi:hypothetical protein